MVLPQVKKTEEKSYFRTKQIRKFISAIEMDFVRGMYDLTKSGLKPEEKTQILDLLRALIEFREASDPKNFSLKNSEEALSKIKPLMSEIEKSIRATGNPETESYLQAMLDYAKESIAQREARLLNKKSIDKPFNIVDTQVYKPPEAYKDVKPVLKMSKGLEEKGKLGEGGFGAVFKVAIKESKKKLAAKAKKLGLTSEEPVLAVKVSTASNQDELDFKKEAYIGNKIRKAALKGGEGAEFVNVITLGKVKLGSGPEKIAIFSKLETNGGLTEYLTSQDRLQMPATEKVQLLEKLFSQQQKGLAFLHRNNIIHRDLAMRNILVSADGNAKISDFGWAEEIGSREDAFVRHNKKTGPLKWLDYRTLNTHESDRNSDRFSLKVAFLEEFATIITGDPEAIWPEQFKTAVNAAAHHLHTCATQNLSPDEGYLQTLTNHLRNMIKALPNQEDAQVYLGFLQKMCVEHKIPLEKEKEMRQEIQKEPQSNYKPGVYNTVPKKIEPNYATLTPEELKALNRSAKQNEKSTTTKPGNSTHELVANSLKQQAVISPPKDTKKMEPSKDDKQPRARATSQPVSPENGAKQRFDKAMTMFKNLEQSDKKEKNNTQEQHRPRTFTK